MHNQPRDILQLVRWIFFTAIFLIRIESADACDPCALYQSSRLRSQKTGSFSLAVSEQYTDFKRSQAARKYSVKDAEFVRGFSTTYVTAAYDVSDDLSVQTLIPFIVRNYDKIDNYRTSNESEEGIGDSVVLANYLLAREVQAESAFIWAVFGGIKTPTGDTGSLGQVGIQDAATNDTKLFSRHHQISGVGGGRALTLGSGSYDYVVGSTLFSRVDRFLTLVTGQYTVRTEGDFNYEFADDVVWSVGPGYYLSLQDEYTIAARLNLSGEMKGKDIRDGSPVEGSRVSNLFLGPELLMTIGDRWTADLGMSFRVNSNDYGATVLPETRVTSSVSYRF